MTATGALRVERGGVEQDRGARLAWAEEVLRRAERKTGVKQESHLLEAGFRESGGLWQELGMPSPRGALVGVAGSTSLVLSLVAEAMGAEGWAAIVGMPTLGAAAAVELGVDLARVVLVPAPGAHAAGVLAAAIDGFDVVVVGEGAQVAPGARRSLVGRARERGTALLTPPWPEAPTRLHATVAWRGLGRGRGYLSGGQLSVRRSGRGGERIVERELCGGRLPEVGREVRGVG